MGGPAGRYPSHQTCHRRFQRWVRAGALRIVLEILAQALHDEGYLDLRGEPRTREICIAIVASSGSISRAGIAGPPTL